MSTAISLLSLGVSIWTIVMLHSLEASLDEIAACQKDLDDFLSDWDD